MQVSSLGFRTDLALLRLGGSVLEDREDHVVVRTAHNPTFRWGNFLLLAASAPLADARSWLDRFRREFPDADYVAIGLDGGVHSAADLHVFREVGLRIDASAVMTATAVTAPPRVNHAATYRRLTSDDDWAQSVELALACIDEDEDPRGYQNFIERRKRTDRDLTESGHGAWFGAFLDRRLVCQMGLLSAGPRLARFQHVETHPDVRRRGLAGTLVHHVSSYGFRSLGAKKLVMVADPDYAAIRIYRSVGFTATESQVQCERKPAGA